MKKKVEKEEADANRRWFVGVLIFVYLSYQILNLSFQTHRKEQKNTKKKKKVMMKPFGPSWFWVSYFTEFLLAT